MRRIAFIAVAATLVACSKDTTAPATTDLVTEFTNVANGTVLTTAGGYDADLYQLRLFHGLPDDLKLTSEQEAKIKALVDAYNAATRADHKALEDILKAARKALNDHKSPAEVKVILDAAAPIAARLKAAADKLKADIDAVLTPEQRAWIASHQPKKCDRNSFPPLTDAQKAQMKAFEAAFETANKADIEAVRKGMADIKAAIAAGKSAAEVQALFDGIKPAIGRLEAARKALRAQLESVLTPEQKASGCFPLG